MSPSAQTGSIIFATILGYVWVSSPQLRPFSLQLTAVLFLVYIIYKRINKAKIHHIAPTALTAETAILYAALLLIIGSTGGIGSIFLPTLFLLLFLSMLVLDLTSLAVLSITIPFFLWLILPTAPTGHEWATLLAFPAMLPLLVFAKLQHDEAQGEKRSLTTLTQEKEREEFDTAMFLNTFLAPKLHTLFKLTEYPQENRENIRKQIQIMLENIHHVTNHEEIDEK